MVAADHPDPENQLYYLAGPAAQVGDTAAALAGRGIPSERLMVEGLD
jgi:ferredoxin-NADP reductase